MIHELIQNSQRVEHRKSQLKTVQLKVANNLMLNFNDNADQPIFQKKIFKYDKYELAKIIGFDQFQLLIRPYKNDATFKRNILWNKITRLSPLMLFLVLIPQIIFIRRDTNHIILIVWAISALVIFTLLFTIVFYSQRVRNKCIRKLSDYCANMSLQQENLQINFIWKKRQNSWMRCLAAERTFFEVKSRIVEEDDKVVKLYTNGGFNIFSSSLDKPIFIQNSYQFDKDRLQKIISFEQLQLIFRPFKSNEAYKKTVFWNKVIICWVPFVFLSLVPLLFHNKGEDDKYLLIISLTSFILIYLSFIPIVWRLNKLKTTMVADFIQYCHTVSRQQQKIEAIIHLVEKQVRIQDCCKTIDIYCLQIKSKSN